MFTRSDGSISDSFDHSHVFTFPLTPMPLSLCYCDGTMTKREQTALFRHLESKIESSFPSSASVEAFVVDGRLAATLFIQATALSCKRVDIIFDTYETPSIKRMERERRGTCYRNCKSMVPQQTRPADLNEALKSPSFKTELPTFLLNEWKEQAYAHIMHERHVYVGHLGECLHFFVEDGVVRHDTNDVGPTGLQPRRSRHPHLPPHQGHILCWKRQQQAHKGLRY